MTEDDATADNGRPHAVGAPVERPVRPLVQRLRHEAMHTGYKPTKPWDLLMEAADELERRELSPEFTDTARAALLWVLWHHQGGSSPIGQPIRFALGIGEHEPLTEHQVQEALRWGRITKSRTSDFHGA